MRVFTVVLLVTALLFAGSASGQGVGSIITQSIFNEMLPNRNNAICPAKGFYTYNSFIQAARAFPAFGTTGDLATRKRELAAFFGQTSHETNGGAQNGPFTWGYCYKEEIDKTVDAPYYGRGPIQLTGRANYQQAGDALHVDLVNNPNLITTNPVIAFKTAIWFWMTPQGAKPSAHAVMTGQWTPSAAVRAANRLPGYGVVTNIINGGIECGKGPLAEEANRVSYYKHYCDLLGVSYGENLSCTNQQHF